MIVFDVSLSKKCILCMSNAISAVSPVFIVVFGSTREKLEKLDGVESVSGLGLMIGIALKDKKAIDVANAALEKGLLVLTAKTKVRLLPPLTITDEEIEKGVAILADVLSK